MVIHEYVTLDYERVVAVLADLKPIEDFFGIVRAIAAERAG